jgi:hypothetical protein
MRTSLGAASVWRRLKDERRPQLAATQVLDQSLAEDAVPAFDGSQLLRSFAQLGKEGSDARQRATRPMMFAMRAGNRDRGEGRRGWFVGRWPEAAAAGW